MLRASNGHFLFQVSSDALCHLVAAPVLRESAILLGCSHRSLALRCGFRVLLECEGRLALLATPCLCEVSLALLSLTILLHLKELGAFIAELFGQRPLLLFVTHDLGATVLRNHLYKDQLVQCGFWCTRKCYIPACAAACVGKRFRPGRLEHPTIESRFVSQVVQE